MLVRLFFKSTSFLAFVKLLFCLLDFPIQGLQAFMSDFEDTRDKCRMHRKHVASEFCICINSLLQKTQNKSLMVVTAEEVQKRKRVIEKIQRSSEKWPPLSREAKGKMKGFQLMISLIYICLLLKTSYMYMCREQCITIWKINIKLHLNN